MAEAVLAALETDDLETYPNERVRDQCQEKRDDYNGYLRTRRGWFARRMS